MLNTQFVLLLVHLGNLDDVVEEFFTMMVLSNYWPIDNNDKLCTYLVGRFPL